MTSAGAAAGLFVISAPSGTGKSTVARRLTEEIPDLELSVSFTTRPARSTEAAERDYHFVDDAEFDRMVEQDAFLEWADVHGRRYGTGVDATNAVLQRGRDLLLDIDVQGARKVQQGTLATVSVMLLPPDFETLERRLRNRGSEADTERAGRLARARREVEAFPDFDFLVINDDLDRTVSELCAILVAERRRTRRCAPEAQRILSSFPGDGAVGGSRS